MEFSPESDSTDLSTQRVEFTPAARSAIAAGAGSDGHEVVLLSWPAGATYLPGDCYLPGEYDVVLGHVEGCPVYVDARRLALFPNRRVVLDAEASSPSHPHPALRARLLPARESGRDMLRTDLRITAPHPGLVQRLVRELSAQFGAVFSEPLISTFVRKAVSDLRGSVTAESLPEMAARLAHHRLTLIDRTRGREARPHAATVTRVASASS